jgi:hypothetical protein
MLRKFERDLTEAGWEEVQPGVDVKFASSPEGTNETFLLCRSQGRQEKEQAILNRFITRMEVGLRKLKEQAEKSKRPDRQKVERRIGRLLERNSRAASLFDVSVDERQTENGPRLAVTIRKQEERTEWALHTSGSYLLRTNWHGSDPKELWKLYIQRNYSVNYWVKTQIVLDTVFARKLEFALPSQTMHKEPVCEVESSHPCCQLCTT